MTTLINLFAQLLYVGGWLVTIGWVAIADGVGSACVVSVVGAVIYPLIRALFPLPRADPGQ